MKKKILFDFITLQDKVVNGGAEYTYKVFDELVRKNDVLIIPIVDSLFEIPERTQTIINKYKLKLVDINNGIDKIIVENDIDLLFIGIAQRWFRYPLEKIRCKTAIVCHDVGDLCLLYDNKYKSVPRNEFIRKFTSQNTISIKKKLYRIYKNYIKGNKKYLSESYSKFQEFIQRDNVHIITVSQYSVYSIRYFFDNIANEIQNFGAPQKLASMNIEVENEELRNLINSKRKFFLMVSCDRESKNAALLLEVWNKFCISTNNQYYAVLLGNLNDKFSMRNVINIKYLNAEDLENAYKNAFALIYPSLSEGYGYPPCEAMKYGTPVIASNVTSIPEICKDFVMYFSPFYPEDLFKCMMLCCDDYMKWREKALEFTTYNTEIQKSNFKALIEYLLFL